MNRTPLPHWKLEACTEPGIFNQSYMITEPDPNWPDDPDERKVVCRFPTGAGEFGPHYKNAKLIEAAPELLEACLKVANDPYTTCQCAEVVRAAITKAIGQ